MASRDRELRCLRRDLAAAERERDALRGRVADLERAVAVLQDALVRARAPIRIELDVPLKPRDDVRPVLPPELLLQVAEWALLRPPSGEDEIVLEDAQLRRRRLLGMAMMSRACYRLLAPLLVSCVDVDAVALKGKALFRAVSGVSHGSQANAVRTLVLSEQRTMSALASGVVCDIVGRFTRLRSLELGLCAFDDVGELFSLPLEELEELRLELRPTTSSTLEEEFGDERFRLPPLLRKLTVTGLAYARVVAAFLRSCHGRLEPDFWLLLRAFDSQQAADEFVERMPDEVLSLWKRFTVEDWQLFSALVARPSFRPESIDASGSEPDYSDEAADLHDFECLLLLPSLKHLHLNAVEVRPRLGDVRLPPNLQTLRIDNLWIDSDDDPASVARFAEELRRLPARPVLTVNRFWDSFVRDSLWAGPLVPRRLLRCLEVLRESDAADVRFDDLVELTEWACGNGIGGAGDEGGADYGLGLEAEDAGLLVE
ncbi:hypothetical protein DFJ74DRAFT_644931 [Hyaloraphidium curvatum]|nr:hypothetical protein DFJ74DRAFT_644931 [Hyaloraphidium curvatum]